MIFHRTVANGIYNRKNVLIEFITKEHYGEKVNLSLSWGLAKDEATTESSPCSQTSCSFFDSGWLLTSVSYLVDWLRQAASARNQDHYALYPWSFDDSDVEFSHQEVAVPARQHCWPCYVLVPLPSLRPQDRIVQFPQTLTSLRTPPLRAIVEQSKECPSFRSTHAQTSLYLMPAGMRPSYYKMSP